MTAEPIRASIARSARSCTLASVEVLDGKKARPEPTRLEMRNDRLSEMLMLAMTGLQINVVFTLSA
jgi:hypothetical protein